IRYIIKEDKIMLKSVMFDLDDTLLWDEKSIEKAFEATCEIAANKYNIDPKELEKNVRISAEAIYTQYETYEFVSNIRIGKYEYFDKINIEKDNELEKLHRIK